MIRDDRGSANLESRIFERVLLGVNESGHDRTHLPGTWYEPTRFGNIAGVSRVMIRPAGWRFPKSLGGSRVGSGGV